MPNINTLLRQELQNCSRGAPMGAASFDDRADKTGKLRLNRIRMVAHDYAPDGTYWGGGRDIDPLWCAYNPESPEHAMGAVTRLYFRARTREAAYAAARKHYGNVSFYGEKV